MMALFTDAMSIPFGLKILLPAFARGLLKKCTRSAAFENLDHVHVLGALFWHTISLHSEIDDGFLHIDPVAHVKGPFAEFLLQIHSIEIDCTVFRLEADGENLDGTIVAPEHLRHARLHDLPARLGRRGRMGTRFRLGRQCMSRRPRWPGLGRYGRRWCREWPGLGSGRWTRHWCRHLLHHLHRRLQRLRARLPRGVNRR